MEYIASSTLNTITSTVWPYPKSNESWFFHKCYYRISTFSFQTSTFTLLPSNLTFLAILSDLLPLSFLLVHCVLLTLSTLLHIPTSFTTYPPPHKRPTSSKDWICVIPEEIKSIQTLDGLSQTSKKPVWKRYYNDNIIQIVLSLLNRSIDKTDLKPTLSFNDNVFSQCDFLF